MQIDEHLAYLTRGCVDIVRAADLRTRLVEAQAAGRPLVVKVGFDPTAPDLHLGHTVLIRKMKHFQDMGHTVVFLIGDFTGLIGDPTGRSKTRPALTPEAIQANADTYRQQVFRILDPQKTVVDFNSRWLGTLTSVDWIRLAAQYNVAQMLERREFRQRYEAGQPIALHEFLYPLSQGYDSVVLKADVELGGTDQLFNLNVGRDIMPAYGLPAQIILTTPLLVGLDGVEKMSKSLGNYVGIDEAPDEMVRKIVEDFRGSDEVLWSYFTLLTDLSIAEIEARTARFAAGAITASELRYELAERIVADYHGRDVAVAAVQAVRARHAARQGRRQADELPVHAVPAGILLRKLLVDQALAGSGSDATRKIAQGGVRVDGEVVTDMNAVVAAGIWTIQAGKKLIVRVRAE
ncbi:tyrosine--tRNA ligase [Luteitalea sp.]|uniref:tyrosine--tRNA ligase n=1 Tax=Luteitalea sp. TaxID=2004800 RepID=UPI0025B8A5B0|nr:tyrosine--tRNA ligase [Luteitalea sp.]